MADEKNSKILATHVVVKGDTPWDLARKYYGFGTKWPIIMEFNSKEKGKLKKTLIDGETIKIPKLPEPPDENSGSENARLVKIDIANLEGRKLLQQDIGMLNGVSEDAAQVLKDQLKVISIFDLAMSHYFNVARALVDSGSPLEASFLQHGFIPGDALRGDPKDMDLKGLKNADIGEMNFGDETTATKLQNALNIKTIRDMALWPPFQSARQILLSTFDPTRTTKLGEDPEAPADLIPATGNYPTECVYYTSVYLDEIDGDQDNLTDLSQSGGVSLFSEDGITQGFDRPARGGILTYRQSWYAQGVTLGQLLHSLALAPGESTRIAMVDWYRRTSERTDEKIKEADVLSQTAQQARSISEITKAVASEMQYGDSLSSSFGKSNESGWSIGIASGGSASSMGLATNVSRSGGQRKMSAAMNQNILSRTQQHATAERSRRATVVRESFQQEKETLTTRVVTNYNHMHAMTVQYYEVVQVYRVATEVWDAERVLFIPMKAINFNDPRVFTRYKELLKVVAPNDGIRNKLDSWDGYFDAEVTGIPAKYHRFSGGDLPIEALTPRPIWLDRSPTLERLDYQSDVKIVAIHVSYVNDDSPKKYSRDDRNNLIGSLDLQSTSLNTLEEIVFEFEETEMDSEAIENRIPSWIKYQYKDSVNRSPSIKEMFYPPVKETDAAPAQGPDDVADVDENAEKKTTLVTVLQVKINSGEPALIQHLQDNPRYSYAIWLSLDSMTLSQLLAGYMYEGKGIASYVEPVPVAITGNYLGFRWKFGDSDEEQQKEKDWRQKVMGLNKPVEAEIPLPSGGVFAEAVLGRFNSAEKLDITRFWNWQDSPIPFAAPDIAPLTAGGKSDQTNLTPGQLGQPAVSINAAPGLPDPTGMNDIMQAIAVSNMFRDMSGQAATIALAGQGMDTASKGASHALEQTNENVRTYISTMGDVAKEVIPLVATKGLSGASVSKAGAAANLADKIDREGGDESDGKDGNKKAVLSSLIGGISSLLKKK
ncbi:MAG TPA: LysM peptidoglycan-binding domain-containing protein [Anaerolineales bacterium]